MRRGSSPRRIRFALSTSRAATASADVDDWTDVPEYSGSPEYFGLEIRRVPAVEFRHDPSLERGAEAYRALHAGEIDGRAVVVPFESY